MRKIAIVPRVFISSCLIAFLLIGSTYAANDLEEVRSVNQDLNAGTPLDRKQRKTLAESLLAAMRSYDRNFPNLTPDEWEYVEQESQRAEGERRTRLINSQEYLIWEVRVELKHLISTLETLSASDIQQAREIRYWALVVYYMTGHVQNNYARLRDRGDITQTTLVPPFLNTWARSILRETIIKQPYK